MLVKVFGDEREKVCSLGRLVEAVVTSSTQGDNVLLNAKTALRPRYIMGFGVSPLAAKDAALVIPLPYRRLDFCGDVGM